MTRALALTLIFCLVSAPVMAIGVDETPLPDPAQEERARDLMEDLRCLVCQNQSVEESDADMAKDIRVIVRERIAAGDSDAEVRTFMTDRYGDWILMKPPFKAGTALLWIGPFVLVLVGGLAAWLFVRRQSRTAPEPLSNDERARLDALLDDGPKA